MVSSEKKLANAIRGKTARACDSCIRKRARWYCAADDAFLCQGCDVSVHSANPLARRHERVQLKIFSSPKLSLEKSLPSWHHGFTRKARTPRGGKHSFLQTPGGAKSEESMIHSFNFNPLHLVPEIGADVSTSHDDSEEQLLYRVPVFDPHLCFLTNEAATPVKAETTKEDADVSNIHDSKLTFDVNSLNGLMLPSDMELAEFAADVESLLGKGLAEESFDMEGLGLLNCREREKDSTESSRRSEERVKVEEEEMQCQVDSDIDMMREPFQLNFDYDSPITWEEDENLARPGEIVVKEDEEYELGNGNNDMTNKKILKLDYEGVIAAWDDQRSPWTTGDRPELDPYACWPDFMGGYGIMHHPCGEMGMMMKGNPAMLDGGREARVSRYREKRRTRLFSKKIRYEVRKLNAEKRPRMKGRFVKRENFGAPAIDFPLLAK